MEIGVDIQKLCAGTTFNRVVQFYESRGSRYTHITKLIRTLFGNRHPQKDNFSLHKRFVIESAARIIT